MRHVVIGCVGILFLASGCRIVLDEDSTKFDAGPGDAGPPMSVSGNNTCDDAYRITAAGGVFVGSTATHTDDVTATCGGMATSPDAMFELTLSSQRRVVVSTVGSGFDTVLHIHETMCVSGSELFCDDDGGGRPASRIDQMLDAGTYFIIVDGFESGASGNYVLAVSITP